MSLPAWMKHSACIPHIAGGDDPWHPDDEEPRRVQAAMYERARVVCVACPVQVLCGRRGLVLLETDGVDGMYGGMTPDELRALARSLARPTRKVAQEGSRSCYIKGCGHAACRAANTRYESARRAQKAFATSANT